MLQRRTNEEVKLQRGRRQDDKDSGNWSGTEPTHSRSAPTKLNDLCFCLISGAKLQFFFLFVLFCFNTNNWRPLTCDLSTVIVSRGESRNQNKTWQGKRKWSNLGRRRRKYPAGVKLNLNGMLQTKTRHRAGLRLLNFKGLFFETHLETGAWEHNKHTGIRCLRCRRIKTSPRDKTSVTSPKNNIEI